MSDNRQSIKEINEAILAGERALTALNEAERSMKKAKGFGVWDMLGGGLISGMLKHSNIDSAQEYMDTAKYELNRFSKELNDVHMSYDIDIKFDEFSRFADYLFDGIFVDFMVQSKMNESYDKIIRIKEQVQEFLNKLKELRRHEEERLK